MKDEGAAEVPNAGSTSKSSLEEEKVSEVKVEVSDNRSLQSTCNMSKILEPPAFVSDDKSYAEYKFDLKRWSRLCGLDKNLQADMVVYRLDGHPSRIKEKVDTQLGSKLDNNPNGIDELLKFLDGIYMKDDMADAWDKFCQFSQFVKKSDQAMSDFLAEFENYYFKMKKVGCELSDLILAFKLLQASKLNEIDTKLVLTGVNRK